MQTFSDHPVGVDRGKVMLFSDVEDGGAMWTGEGPRLIRRSVRFAKPFRAPPEILLTAEMWDYDSAANARGDLAPDTVTAQGFDIVFKTWGDTRIARLRVGWLAIGAMPHPDEWEL